MKDNKFIKSLEKYKNLTSIPNFKDKKTRDITSVTLTFLALIFFSLFAINPTLSTIARLQRELEDSKFVAEQLERKIHNISALQEQYEKIKVDLPIITAAIPTSPQAPVLLADIRAVAADSNINLSVIQVFPVELDSKTKAQLKASSYSFNLVADGSYENLSTFLEKLSTMRRVISIDQINLTKKTLEENNLQLSLKGSSYFEQ